MIVGAYLDQAAPDHPAGAEWTIHDTLTWLAKRGHDCRIVSRDGYTQERINGVLVYCRPSDDELAQHFAECDVMLTQLGATMHAQILAMKHQTPLAVYAHSASQLDHVASGACALAVCNSQHVYDATDWWPGERITLRPAIDADRVRVAIPGACTTLVNVSTAKGGGIFWRLAQTMEDVPFLGVQGAYGDQALRPDGLMTYNENEPATGLPANLQVIGAVRDIRTVLGFTRTLLVLSHSETYGRVAGEAAASGIPTICVDTPGLRECLGDAAQYASRDDARELAALVKRGYSDAWNDWSIEVAARWHGTLAPRQETELRRFERALRRIKKEQPVMKL